MGEDYLKEIDAHGKLFVRQVIIETDKAGLPRSARQYVFYVIMDQYNNWPAMSVVRKSALSTGRRIMTLAGDTPEYKDGLTLPDPEDEEKVEKAIIAVAHWCASWMTGSLLGAYSKMLEKYEHYAWKISPESEVSIPEADYVYMDALFRTALENPGVIIAGNLIQEVLDLWAL